LFIIPGVTGDRRFKADFTSAAKITYNLEMYISVCTLSVTGIFSW